MALSKTDTQKRKDDTLTEILRVVQELKEFAQATCAIYEKKEEPSQVPEAVKQIRISDIPYGQTFTRRSVSHMRVRPTSFLLNSTLVSENVCAGKQLVVNIDQGTCFFVENEVIGCFAIK